MENLDEERLIQLMQTTVDVVLGKKTEESISSNLLDIDEHVRSRLINDLTAIFKRGMALRLELDAFDLEIQKHFPDAKLLPKALHQFWRNISAKKTKNRKNMTKSIFYSSVRAATAFFKP